MLAGEIGADDAVAAIGAIATKTNIDRATDLDFRITELEEKLSAKP